MGCKKTSNRVATITSQSTTDDLQQNREKTREVNVLRDLPVSAPINISMDVRYNSTSLENSYGCGQQEIIDVHLENKLCKLGASLHNQGQNMLWPGHQGCTATVYFLQKSASMFSASVAMSQTTIENCIGGHVNVLSVYGKT